MAYWVDGDQLTPDNLNYLDATGIVNVRKYGALGDGTTDDTAAFTAAVAAVPEHGTIVVPASSSAYVLNSTWTINKSIKVLFYGKINSAANTTGAAILCTAINTVLDRPNLDGGGTALDGIKGTAARLVIKQPIITGYAAGSDGSGIRLDGIACSIYHPEITLCSYGLRLERHSVNVYGGRITDNLVHSIWFEGDGGRAFSNQHTIMGTAMDHPAGGAAIKSTGQSNYNYILCINLEGGDGPGLGNYSLDLDNPSGWCIFGSHIINSGVNGKINGWAANNFIFGGFWGEGAIGSDIGTQFMHWAGGQGLVRARIHGLAATEVDLSLTGSDNTFGNSGTLWRVDSDAANNINGIVANEPGRLAFIQNVGAYEFVLADESSSASETRRIQTSWDGNLWVNPGCFALLYYDSTIDRWRPLLWTGHEVQQEVSPAQITANQNNYAPSKQRVWRLSSDASRNITGIVLDRNQMLTLVNVGAQNIVLMNENASSSETNRIITGTGADLTIAAGGVVELWKDGTTDRLRVMSRNF